MHIHGNFMNLHSASLDSATNSERAAAAQRAAETRKKLLNKALDLNGQASPEETLLIGNWLDARHSQVPGRILPGDEYRTAASGRDTDFD